jgi:hypothetical protein
MLDSNDINWIFDLVTAIEEDLQNINIRLSSLERVYKEDRKHMINVLENNSAIIDNTRDDLSGVSSYISSLLKKIVTLEENSKPRSKNKYENYT